MATLATVQDYVAQARELLQDASLPYRYSDANLLTSFNNALMAARRLRPDLFLPDFTVPDFASVDSTTVAVDIQYRTPLVYFMVAYTQMSDDEESTDLRADAYMGKFYSGLVGVI